MLVRNGKRKNRLTQAVRYRDGDRDGNGDRNREMERWRDEEGMMEKEK